MKTAAEYLKLLDAGEMTMKEIVFDVIKELESRAPVIKRPTTSKKKK